MRVLQGGLISSFVQAYINDIGEGNIAHIPTYVFQAVLDMWYEGEMWFVNIRIRDKIRTTGMDYVRKCLQQTLRNRLRNA